MSGCQRINFSNELYIDNTHCAEAPVLCENASVQCISSHCNDHKCEKLSANFLTAIKVLKAWNITNPNGWQKFNLQVTQDFSLFPFVLFK